MSNLSQPTFLIKLRIKTKIEKGTLFFCLLLVMSSVIFDVCSIAFVVPFSIFVLICDYCTPLSLKGFPMLQLCCPFLLNLKLSNEQNNLHKSVWGPTLI